MLDGDPKLSESGIELFIVVGQRMMFGRLNRDESKRKVLIHALIAAVHHGDDMTRQRFGNALFEHPKVMRRAYITVDVQYFPVLCVNHDLVLCRMRFFYPSMIPLGRASAFLSAVPPHRR